MYAFQSVVCQLNELNDTFFANLVKVRNVLLHEIVAGDDTINVFKEKLPFC